MNQFLKIVSSAAVDAARSCLRYGKRDAKRSNSDFDKYFKKFEKLTPIPVKQIDESYKRDPRYEELLKEQSPEDVVNWTMVHCPDDKIRYYKEGSKDIPSGSLIYLVKIQQIVKKTK